MTVCRLFGHGPGRLLLDSEESHEAAAESKVEKEERAILHRFLQADGKNAQDNADDGPTHEEYADFLQLVAPDQTRLDEFRRTRNVQEHAGTLFCSLNCNGQRGYIFFMPDVCNEAVLAFLAQSQFSIGGCSLRSW